jgi:hypothetical protein
VFRNLSIRGDTGAILWGYHDAAVLQRWFIVHKEPDRKRGEPSRWILTATFARIDHFCLRQRPLMFSAKREGLKGYWCWPLITDSIVMGDASIQAHLGPPEQ